MKFRVSRTSNYRADEKPCEKAYGGTPMKDDEHKLVWFIDIGSLEELLLLREELREDLIIGIAWEEELNQMPEIEIYDDYRE